MARKKEERLEVIPFEESYPYNVLYDLLKVLEDEDETENGVPIIINSVKEKLAEYDIYEFIAYMNTRLTDRELRCVECKYRYNMTLEETAKVFNVTRERIRQILAKAERNLRAKLFKCRKIVPEAYTDLLNQHIGMGRTYDKLLLLLEKISGESPMSILEALDDHPILSKEITPDPIDNLEFKSVKDITNRRRKI